jgi:hypothetical protein
LVENDGEASKTLLAEKYFLLQEKVKLMMLNPDQFKEALQLCSDNNLSVLSM